jgi:hypothetical protein
VAGRFGGFDGVRRVGARVAPQRYAELGGACPATS